LGGASFHLDFFREADRCVCFSARRATLRDTRPLASAMVGGATIEKIDTFSSHHHCLICRYTSSLVPITRCLTTRLGPYLLATHWPAMMSTRNKQPSLANTWPVELGMTMMSSLV
jgi:hypothetical protein